MKKIETWIATTIFALGIIIGMAYLNFVREAPTSNLETPQAQVSQPKPFLEITKPEQRLPDWEVSNRATSLERGDTYFLAGNYDAALENYYQLTKSESAIPTSIILRESICLEKQKQYEKAAKHYSTASNSTSTNHQLLAIAGYARCLMKSGKRKDALVALADQLLKQDQFGSAPQEVSAQLFYAFAKLLETSALESQSELTEPFGLAFEEHTPTPDRYLSVIDQAQASPAEPQSPALQSPTPQSAVKILQRPSSSLNVISASVSVKLHPVLELIGELAIAAELNLLVSEQAESALSGRSKSVEMSGPVSACLDRMLVPLDLVWYQLNSDLHVVGRTELDPAIAPNQIWFDASLRAYRQFELNFPDDERRLASLLSRANLNLIQKRLDVAINRYQELKQARPTGEVLTKLFFNEAKLKLLLGQDEEASRLLYLAVDQTHDPEIESSSYCLLGSFHLSNNELDESVKTSRRGLASAVNDHQRQLAALNLARAYLLKGEPFSANQSLFQNRDAFVEKNNKTMAAVLGAYARFSGVTDKLGQLNARNRLLSALTMTPSENYKSFVDCYLAGQAYEKLGFREQAIAKLLFALARPDVGKWRRQIILELAVLQKRDGNFGPAMQALQSLVEVDDQWTLIAKEQLASIYLETKQTDLCIRLCKELIQADLEKPRKQAALQILGDAFQMQGEHHAAALCFAGMLPDNF